MCASIAKIGDINCFCLLQISFTLLSMRSLAPCCFVVRSYRSTTSNRYKVCKWATDQPPGPFAIYGNLTSSFCSASVLT